MTDEYLDPKTLMKRLDVDALCAASERYFQDRADAEYLLRKPFADLVEAPQLILHLGLVLSALKLGRDMTIVDFGAGTCWLTRILTQLGCEAIAVDPSATALDIGRRLFAEQPVVGKMVHAPQFLLFDGRRIALEDGSADRIVCFDAFHHVPNQRTVLAEFHRVLRPGGLAAFSEPGAQHSRHHHSQREMRQFEMLENDIVIEDVRQLAAEVGFDSLSFKPLFGVNDVMSFADHQATTADGTISIATRDMLADALRASHVFTLTKGQPRADSRSYLHLSHRLELVAGPPPEVRAGQPFGLTMRVTNTGAAQWLTKTASGDGIVLLGLHLETAAGKRLASDFLRFKLGPDVLPGETREVRAEPIAIAEPGAYRLVFDLVSEHVIWFEAAGSLPVTVDVHVR